MQASAALAAALLGACALVYAAPLREGLRAHVAEAGRTDFPCVALASMHPLAIPVMRDASSYRAVLVRVVPGGKCLGFGRGSFLARFLAGHESWEVLEGFPRGRGTLETGRPRKTVVRTDLGLGLASSSPAVATWPWPRRIRAESLPEVGTWIAERLRPIGAGQDGALM
jgi:hypothetical protein